MLGMVYAENKAPNKRFIISIMALNVRKKSLLIVLRERIVSLFERNVLSMQSQLTSYTNLTANSIMVKLTYHFQYDITSTDWQTLFSL